MEDITRRDLLHKTINSLIGLWVATASVLSGNAGIRYIWPTEKTAGPPGEKKISFPIVELQEGGMKKILIDGKPHLGCIVSWHPEEKRLICPCHAGIYDINGAVLGGPPPRPLPSYEVREIGDKVVVG